MAEVYKLQPKDDTVTEERVRQIVSSMQRTSIERVVLAAGLQQSQNFISGTSGWQIDSQGNAEFNNGTFRGTFNIGGTTITINSTEDIQTNLDAIDTAGGGTLFLQNGTYTLTSDITIPSGVVLEGVSRDGVIIDCNTSYAVKITGTNVYTTGTVTINNGDTTLVGTGTTWTSAMVGRFVFLNDYWFEITAFTDTTHLTIEEYTGTNISGGAYVISSINSTSSLTRVTVRNATGSGVVVQYAIEPFLNDIAVLSCGTGIEMDYVIFPRMLVTANENGSNLNLNYTFGFTIDFSDFSYSTTGAGIVMTNSGNANIYSTSITNNTGNGVSLTSCDKIPFIGLDISNNGAKGMEFISGCDDCQVTSCTLDGNTSDGIKFTATDDRNIVNGNSIINNGGYGINIAASTCDDNSLNNNAFTNNTSGNIANSGTTSKVDAAYALIGGQILNTPADSTSYFFGGQGFNPSTTEGIHRVYIAKLGTIKAAYIQFINNGTLGTNETSSIYVRLNATTDTLISSNVKNDSGLATPYVVSSTALSINVVAGDYFEIKWTTPAWATNPTQIIVLWQVYIE